MSKYLFAGTLKSIKVGKDGSKRFLLLYFVPDAGFSVSHKNGELTQKVVVFHPAGKWEDGLSFCYDDFVVLKTESKDLYGLVLCSHCELEVAEVSTESLFDFSFQNAPRLGVKSVVGIKVF